MLHESNSLDRLAGLLAARADARGRRFWTRLLGPALPALGTPDVLVRTIMHAWWKAEKLGSAPARLQRGLALALLTRPHVEEKLAGIQALAEIVLPRLDGSGLADLHLVLDSGALPDPYLVAQLEAKVLGPLTRLGPGRPPGPGGAPRRARSPAGRRRRSSGG